MLFNINIVIGGEFMIIAFIAGVFIAGIGVLISVAANNWQIAFIISGIIAVISVALTSLFRNIAIVGSKRAKVRNEKPIKAIDSAEVWAKVTAIVGFPNIIIAVWLYLKLYM